ncbi:MAG TPA: 50S ribosomal protein L11 methyltransferase [Ferruginibacter sp.]|nr:50S ribosomal protein L11 methyltransferase [Ferruginibacter sp.]
MNYIQVTFNGLQNNETEILIALLANAGFESFEEKENTLKAFIKEPAFGEALLHDIICAFPVKYSISVVPEQNWNAQWESSFEPIVINDFVAIRAGFHSPIKHVRHEIVITPKMSFGTGHHATTYMMIEQMKDIDFKNKRVLDFGTGTAVLAILAEKMGAAKIDAIDYDQWSIENSKENSTINNCNKINLLMADTISGDNKYNIILANINLNVIKENLTAIKASAVNNGYILLSGFLKADEEEMERNLTLNNMIIVNTIQKAEWICILAKNMQ